MSSRYQSRQDPSSSVLRIHMSRKPVSSIRSVTQDRSPQMKPEGFWYGIGRAWLDWVESEVPERVGEHFYAVDLDEEGLLKLATEDDVSRFVRAYGHGYSYEKVPGRIDWRAVAERYSGVEVNPYLWSLRYDGPLWYNTWDVASGCVWEAGAVKRLTEISAPEPEDEEVD